MLPLLQRGNLNTRFVLLKDHLYYDSDHVILLYLYRLRKLDEQGSVFSAILLAYAGIARMGWKDRISEILPPSTILHAVGQGALGIECREDDEFILQMLSTLTDYNSTLRCSAERSFMRALEGGCSVPLGVNTCISWKKASIDKEQDRIKGVFEYNINNNDVSITKSAASTLYNNDNNNDNRPSESSNESYTVGWEGELALQGSVTSLDGSEEIRKESKAILRIPISSSTEESMFSSPNDVAFKMAVGSSEKLGKELGRIFIENGAQILLSEIRK